MTLNLLAHDQVLQEVLAGTGATLVAEAAPAGPAGERDDVQGMDVFTPRSAASSAGFNLKAFLISFGLWGAAGGAALLAVPALIAAYQSLDQVEAVRGRLAYVDASLAALPALEQNIQILTAAQKKLEEVSRAQQEALQSTSGKVAQVEMDLRLSLDAVDRKLTKVADKSKELEAAAALRMDRSELDKTVVAAVPAPPRAADPTPARDPVEKSRRPVFRLAQIDAGVATLDGPNGPLTVTVGDTVPGLGKILKIGKRARNAVIVAAKRTLTAPWSQVAADPSRPDAAKADVDKKAARPPAVEAVAPAH